MRLRAHIGTVHGAPTSYLLDLYPGATFVYSFRKVSSTYTGACIRIKNLVTSQETDIGFSGDWINENEIVSFANGNDCIGIRWYDSTGNGNTLNMNYNGYNQYIYKDGSLVKKDGFLYFLFKPYSLTYNNVYETANQTTFVSLKFDALPNTFTRYIGPQNGSNQFYQAADNRPIIYNSSGTVLISTVAIDTSRLILTMNIASTNSGIWINGNRTAVGNMGAPAAVTGGIQGIGIDTFYNEIIQYNFNNLENIIGINENIRNAYPITTP